jgi:tRNA dimethylallyltransferase
MQPLAIAIMGPTASGKSEVAEALADRLEARIVNADAFQVYRHLDIGTNKPADLGRYDLVNLLEPSESFSVGGFVDLAGRLAAEYRAAGRHVVVCGGTGLYVRALFEGYAEMSPSDPELRSRLRAEFELLGAEGIASKYGVPAISNPVRLTRAIEKQLQGAAKPTGPVPLDGFRKLKFGLQSGKERLDELIEKRVHSMVQNGWLGEVEKLLSAGADLEWPAFRAIGYRELAEVVAGRMQLDAAIERIFVRTRQYAKRQMTWLRKEPGLVWLETTDRRQAVGLILNRIGEEL